MNVKASFFVPGHPVTQGSKRGFVVPGKHGGKPRAIVVDVKDKELRSWRGAIADTAMLELHKQRHTTGPVPSHVPVLLSLRFGLRRPASHFTAKGALNAQGRRRVAPTGKPDASKLARAVEDAMSGVVWHDDAQIVALAVHKEWTTGPEGVQVTIAIVEPADAQRALDDEANRRAEDAIDELERAGA